MRAPHPPMGHTPRRCAAILREMTAYLQSLEAADASAMKEVEEVSHLHSPEMRAFLSCCIPLRCAHHTIPMHTPRRWRRS